MQTITLLLTSLLLHGVTSIPSAPREPVSGRLSTDQREYSKRFISDFDNCHLISGPDSLRDPYCCADPRDENRRISRVSDGQVTNHCVKTRYEGWCNATEAKMGIFQYGPYCCHWLAPRIGVPVQHLDCHVLTLTNATIPGDEPEYNIDPLPEEWGLAEWEKEGLESEDAYEAKTPTKLSDFDSYWPDE